MEKFGGGRVGRREKRRPRAPFAPNPAPSEPQAERGWVRSEPSRRGSRNFRLAKSPTLTRPRSTCGSGGRDSAQAEDWARGAVKAFA